MSINSNNVYNKTHKVMCVIIVINIQTFSKFMRCNVEHYTLSNERLTDS